MIKTFLVVDVETTGLDYQEDRVIEYGYAAFDEGRLTVANGGYIQSDVPNKAQHINNITPYMIENGETQREAMNHLWGLLTNLVKVNRPLCAYNAPFDLSFLAYSFQREGLTFDFSKLKVLDPLVIHRHYDKEVWAYKSGARKLIRMAERYKLSTPDHSAQADSVTAGELMLTLPYHFPIGSASALVLHRHQERWHKEWTNGLARLVYPRPVKITPWPLEVPEYPCSSPRQSSFSLEYSPDTSLQLASPPPF